MALNDKNTVDDLTGSAYVLLLSGIGQITNIDAVNNAELIISNSGTIIPEETRKGRALLGYDRGTGEPTINLSDSETFIWGRPLSPSTECAVIVTETV